MNKKISISLLTSCIIATNLLSATQKLDEITITSATKSEQSIKDVTSNVEVITKEDIEERHFTTVSEALNSLVGVSFTQNGSIGSSSSLYLRGMDNSRTLVLIDGVKFQDPSNTSGANISHLMIGDIERIEVIKGAQSGIWGAEAAAGVVNIITRKAKKGTNVYANIEGGSFSTRKYALSLSYALENFDVKLAANKIISNGFSNLSPKDKNPKDFENDSYKNTTLALDSNVYLSENTKINFNVKNIDARVDYDSFGKPNDNTMKSDVNTQIYSTSLNHKISNHNFKLKYELSKFEREEIGTKFGVKNFNGQTQNIELSDEIKYIKDGFLLLGLGVNSDDVDYIKADKTTNDKNSKNKYIYITNSNSFDKFVLTQSLRFDKYNNFDNQFTGKIGAKYFVNEDLSFSSNYGTAYNVPSIMKQLNPWGEKNFYLQPEKTKSFDIGLEYRNFIATYFKSKVDNLINWEGKGYKNISGETDFEGVELSYKVGLTNDLLLSLNYNYLEAKDSKGKRLQRRVKDSFKASVDYYGIRNLHLNLNSEYVGDRKQEIYKVGEVDTGNYVLFNSMLNYDLNKNLKAYLKVDNIFNKKYQTVYGYGSASRSAYVGLNYKF